MFSNNRESIRTDKKEIMIHIVTAYWVEEIYSYW